MNTAFPKRYKNERSEFPIEINYPGTNNNSQFTFDPIGRNVKTVEVSGGTTTSTKQFVWCGVNRCEERDVSGSLNKRFFALGQNNGGTNYWYTTDHLGAVREVTDGSGNIQTQYLYDPYGRVTKIQGGADSDFQYAGYYLHASSGLNLTVYRAYNGKLGRWLSRDPIGDPSITQSTETLGAC